MILLISAVQQEFNPDCDVAFQEFVDKFNKSYEEGKLSDARDVFCYNYNRMLQLIKENKCPDCGVTQIMDRTLNELVTDRVDEDRKRVVVEGTKRPTKTSDHRNVIPAIELPWPDNLKIYSSIDLREAGLQGKAKDQGSCGSCWAFGVTAVLEGLILLDRDWGLAREHPEWDYDVNNCSLSEQFIMSNIWGSANYCAGGSFMYAIDYMTYKFKTVETTAHFPNKFPLYYRNWELKNGLEPKLYPWQYYLPFASFKLSNYNYSLVRIYDSSKPISTNPRARNKVMQAITRGIPVSGMMYVPNSFIHYTGKTVAHLNCGGQRVNHQITFVGYGKKGGKNVWLVRNSWGEGWGAKGYFFLEREKNSFCSEMSFYTVLPYYRKTKQDHLESPGERKRDWWSLDYEVPELVDPNPNSASPASSSGFALSYALVIGSSLVAVCVGAIIAVSVVLISRRRKHVYKAKQEQVYSLE